MRWSRWATRPKSATWRNAFLYGAQELRHGVFPLPARVGLGADTLAGLTSDMFFDMMAIRLDPAKAAGQSMVINWHFTDRDEKLVLTLSHCTLSHRLGEWSDTAAASVTTTRGDARPDDPRQAQPPQALASGATRDRRRCARASPRCSPCSISPPASCSTSSRLVKADPESARRLTSAGPPRVMPTTRRISAQRFSGRT